MINIFDVGIILLLITFAIIGFKKGVIKELVSFVGIIIVFVFSWLLKGYVGNFLCLYLPFFKFKGVIEGISSINILLYQTIAFIIIFSLLLTVYGWLLKVSKVLQKIVNLTIVLYLPSKLLGSIISFIIGYLLLFIVFVLLFIPFGRYEVYRESTVINYMLYKTPGLSLCTNSFVKPLFEIRDLIDDVSKEKIDSVEADKRSIDIMLEYNIVDEGTVSKLYAKNKLNSN